MRVLLPLSVASFSAQFENPQNYLILWLALTLIGAAGVFDLGFSPTFIRLISRNALSGTFVGLNARHLAGISIYQRSIYKITSALFALIACCIVSSYFFFQYAGPYGYELQLLGVALISAGCFFTHSAAIYRNTLIGYGRIFDTKVIEFLVGGLTVFSVVFYLETEVFDILTVIVLARFF